jgi:hypothetical protein
MITFEPALYVGGSIQQGDEKFHGDISREGNVHL